MASRRRDLGALSPRLLQLSAKTIPVEPYPVTDTISIKQTRKRRDDLHAAYNDIATSQSRIQELARRAGELPAPKHPGDKPTDEQVAAYADELGAWQAQVDIMGQSADEHAQVLKAASERYNRAFFGDAYDAIMELSEDWDPDFYEAFKTDVSEHFLKGVNPPPDGTDDDGNVVDVAESVEAGKLPT